MEQCNPEWTSVPQLAFQFYDHLRRIAEVTLVTHIRNQQALSDRFPELDENAIVYLDESRLVKDYYGVVARLTSRGGVNWPLQHTLGFPVYAEFDRGVARQFGPRIEAGEFDAILGMTPILPRYPYQLSRSERKIPFILGPVNGGLPFPDGFSEIAAKESARFNFLRSLCKLIPGYTDTYEKADRVLAGSRFTLEWIRDTFDIKPHRLCYMAENGVSEDYFETPILRIEADAPLKLLFAGRLVPYKGADILIEAMSLAAPRLNRVLDLTIVGDGPEKAALQRQSHEVGLSDNVHFTGQVPPTEMPSHFEASHLFCFPSIREFGGAVVLEAMASGVPCIVADHGGIGEYVDAECGIKIEPKNRDFLVQQFADAIVDLASDPDGLQRLSQAARLQADSYRWKNKARALLDVIEDAIEEKVSTSPLVLAA